MMLLMVLLNVALAQAADPVAGREPSGHARFQDSDPVDDLVPGALTPAPVGALHKARPFTVEEPAPWRMTAEPLQVEEGWILQLTVDPELARPVQVGQRVLFVDDRPARPVRRDPQAGCMVVWIPGPVDLKQARLYFGSTELPERMDRAHGQTELDAARAAGIRPLPPQQVDRARQAGGDLLRARTLDDVFAAALEITCASAR